MEGIFMKTCPHCKEDISKYDNPSPTADCIIYDEVKGVVLIERKNIPLGLALPGGFIDTGESVEDAAIREMKEETGLDVELLGILGVYSDPKRDPRFHTLTVTFVAKALDINILQAGDDASNANFYLLEDIPSLCFDHNIAIDQFKQYLKGTRTLLPCQE